SNDDLAWEDFQANRLRSRERLVISDSMSDWLEDPGITLNHPIKGEVKTSDVFTYPDLREVTYRPRETPVILRGEAIAARAIELERVLITGVDRSGKTTLGKKLFLDFFDRGYVPVLVKGE